MFIPLSLIYIDYITSTR